MIEDIFHYLERIKNGIRDEELEGIKYMFNNANNKEISDNAFREEVNVINKAKQLCFKVIEKIEKEIQED